MRPAIARRHRSRLVAHSYLTSTARLRTRGPPRATLHSKVAGCSRSRRSLVGAVTAAYTTAWLMFEILPGRARYPFARRRQEASVTSRQFRLQEATIDDIHSAFRSGELTCRGLVELYLARIEAYDKNGPELNSVLTVNPNILEEADEIDRAFEQGGAFLGPLHGIPVLVKDQAETAGIRTTFGSVAFEDYVPQEDATAVRRLKEAGAVILAKTNLPDFATSWFAYSSAGGETKNPYALDRDPGGSSSGTGAAIAANLGAVGIGEDTGGSIRVPSSFDNLVGVRVTTGLISRKGLSPLVVFQDTAGPMTRTVKDSAILLDALVGYDPEDPFTAAATLARDAGSYAESLSEGSLRGARIGVVREVFGPDDDPDSSQVNGVVEGALEAMRGAGADVVDPVSVPDLQHYVGVTSLYLSQSRYDIDGFLADRPGSHTVGELYESKRFHPRLDLFIAIAEDAPTERAAASGRTPIGCSWHGGARRGAGSGVTFRRNPFLKRGGKYLRRAGTRTRPS